MSISEKLTAVSENVPRVYAAGKKSEYDAFWDAYQKKGKRVSYLSAFAGDGWTVETFKPKYNIPITYGYMTFRNSNINADLVSLCSELGITVSFNGCTDFNQTFFNSKFTRVGEINTTSSTTLASTFSNAAVETVDKIILKSDGSQTFTSTFSGCNKLKSIEFDGVIGNTVSLAASPLDTQSIVNVVETLSESAQGKSVSFLTSAIEGAAWSETNYADWQALVATRPNWTFTLS